MCHIWRVAGLGLQRCPGHGQQHRTIKRGHQLVGSSRCSCIRRAAHSCSPPCRRRGSTSTTVGEGQCAWCWHENQHTGLVDCRPLQACCRRHGWGPKALGMCTCSGRYQPNCRRHRVNSFSRCSVQCADGQCIWRRSRRTCRSATSWCPQISSNVAPTVNKASVAAVHQPWQQALPHNCSRNCWHAKNHNQHIVGGRCSRVWVTHCLYASELCHIQQVAFYTIHVCMRRLMPEVQVATACADCWSTLAYRVCVCVRPAPCVGADDC